MMEWRRFLISGKCSPVDPASILYERQRVSFSSVLCVFCWYDVYVILAILHCLITSDRYIVWRFRHLFICSMQLLSFFPPSLSVCVRFVVHPVLLLCRSFFRSYLCFLLHSNRTLLRRRKRNKNSTFRIVKFKLSVSYIMKKTLCTTLHHTTVHHITPHDVMTLRQ